MSAWVDENTSFKEAVRQRKEVIAALRKEDGKAELRRAEVLAACRKGKRCNHDGCHVCARRKLRRLSHDFALPTSYVSSAPGFVIRRVWLSDVEVGERRPLDEGNVRALAASMDLIGLRAPITVREKKKKFTLVSGWHRLEAARRLGWTEIIAFVVWRDDLVSDRFWTLAENLYRADLRVLDRAEQIDEMRSYVKVKKDGAVELTPLGGLQPNEAAINKTAKALGMTREDIRRSKAIAGISAEAKAKARELGLDDHQATLLAVAKLPTPKAQVMAIEESNQRIHEARDRQVARSLATNDSATADKIKGLQETIAKNEDKLDRITGNLTLERKRLRKLEERLVGDCDIAAPLVTAESPPIVPSDGPDLDCPADDASLASLKAAWHNAYELKKAFARASVATRERFMREVLTEVASSQ